jgi:hypothetical protein
MLIMTGEVRGEWLGSDSGAPVNGDQVRDTWFLRRDRSFGWYYTTAKWDTWGYRGLGDVGWGYAASEVDDLLSHVAAELDTDRSAGWLIENATFRRKLSGPRYDIDAVDWFLGQFLLLQDRVALPGLSDDPWRDLAVAQPAQNEVSDLARRYPPVTSRHGELLRRTSTGCARRRGATSARSRVRACGGGEQGSSGRSCAPRSSRHWLPSGASVRPLALAGGTSLTRKRVFRPTALRAHGPRALPSSPPAAGETAPGTSPQKL